MIKYYIMCFCILFLVGCDTESPTCSNITTVINKTITITKEVYTPCPICEQTICPVLENNSKANINKMIYRLDYCQERLNECWLMNTTLYSENLSNQLNQCNNTVDKYKKKYGSIY